MINSEKLSIAVRSRRGSDTLVQAAEKSDVSKDTLSRIERQELVPTLSTFAKLCDWMDMPMDYFRQDGEEPKRVPA